MAAGTVGLLAVCLLVMTFTPGDDESPIAISATTTASDGGGGLRGLSGIGAIGRFASEVDLDGDAPVRVRPALATPIGDGRSALMTSTPAHRSGESFQVQLTSGVVVQAAVMQTSEDGLVVVTIASSDTAHDIADEPPAPDEIVTVLGETTMTVPFGEVDELDLAEGTPVLDADGALVGLCTRTGGQAWILDVTGHDGDTSTSAPPVSDGSVPVSTLPGTATSAPGADDELSADDDATSVAP